jgi:hypothetical protein
MLNAVSAPAVAASFLSFVALSTTDLYLPTITFNLTSNAMSYPSKSGTEASGGILSKIFFPNV